MINPSHFMDENETIDAALEEDTLEEIAEDASDETDWKALALKNQGIAKRLQTKLSKAEKPKEEPKAKKTEPQAQPEGLDETQLDYLDLKGITEDEDVKVIEKIVLKTGMTIRQALKDDYVIEKLKTLKEQRDVKSATPSSTKRTGQTGGNLEQAIARYERDNVLPDDFKLASEVVNALVEKTGNTRPSWG